MGFSRSPGPTVPAKGGGLTTSGAFILGHRHGYASAYAVLIFFVLLGYSRLMNKVSGQKVL